MLLDDVPYLVHLCTGIKITGRIVRIADQYSLGAVGDELLELFDSCSKTLLILFWNII